MDLTLEKAQQIGEACLRIAGETQMKPITIAVLDAAGSLKVLLRQDGTSTMPPPTPSNPASTPAKAPITSSSTAIWINSNVSGILSACAAV